MTPLVGEELSNMTMTLRKHYKVDKYDPLLECHTSPFKYFKARHRATNPTPPAKSSQKELPENIFLQICARLLSCVSFKTKGTH